MLLPPALIRLATDSAELGQIPDPALRWGIRRLLTGRLREAQRRGESGASLAAEMRALPIAVGQDEANAQHYEVPSAFFERMLGPRLKYSSCYYADSPGLAEAEERMLLLCCERAGLENGMRVLDLGCGWGSLSLFIAEHYPRSRVLAISNSAAQRTFITQRAAALGLSNIEVVTCDVSRLEIDQSFDRVFSIEMFEHMRNWGTLFERIAGWLAPEGRFFMHFFCHREHGYLYEDRGAGDWMARNFFSGGIMPSEDLPRHFDEHLQVTEQWRIDGTEYARTLEAWLARIDASPEACASALMAPEAERAVQRWRMFLMACSELFGYDDGQSWFVSHTLLAPRTTQ